MVLDREPLEVRLHPVARAARHDRDLQAQLGRLLEQPVDARPQRLLGDQLALARPARRLDGLAVDRRLEQRVQLVELVGAVQRADPEQEPLARHLDAVLREDLLPGTPVDRLGVDHRPVEVEEERPHGHAAIVESAPWTASGSRPRSASASRRRTRRRSRTTRATSSGSRSPASPTSTASTAATRGCASQGVEALTIESHVRYLAPARFDDRLVIHTRIAQRRGARFRFEYALERPADGALVADGWTAHACVDAATLRPTRVPGWLAEAIASAEAE